MWWMTKVILSKMIILLAILGWAYIVSFAFLPADWSLHYVMDWLGYY